MPTHCRLAALAALILAGSAQAADLRLGLHAENMGFIVDSPETPTIPLFGLEASATQSLGRYVAVRGKIGLEYLGGQPAARIDATLLSGGARSGGNFYFGVGLGTGIFFSDPEFGLFYLTNAHAVIGKNFGPAQLEVYTRVGLGPALGVSLNTLIR